MDPSSIIFSTLDAVIGGCASGYTFVGGSLVNNYKPLFQGTYNLVCMDLAYSAEIYRKADSQYYAYYVRNSGGFFWFFGTAYDDGKPQVILIQAAANCPSDPGTWLVNQAVSRAIFINKNIFYTCFFCRAPSNQCQPLPSLLSKTENQTGTEIFKKTQIFYKK